eukprot:m.28608 g.28608  ORF g.28608 m.28608 type:complete len:694 (+) comp4533_c0_seq1:1259-3340(+)
MNDARILLPCPNPAVLCHFSSPHMVPVVGTFQHRTTPGGRVMVVVGGIVPGTAHGGEEVEGLTSPSFPRWTARALARVSSTALAVERTVVVGAAGPLHDTGHGGGVVRWVESWRENGKTLLFPYSRTASDGEVDKRPASLRCQGHASRLACVDGPKRCNVLDRASFGCPIRNSDSVCLIVVGVEGDANIGRASVQDHRFTAHHQQGHCDGHHGTCNHDHGLLACCHDQNLYHVHIRHIGLGDTMHRLATMSGHRFLLGVVALVGVRVVPAVGFGHDLLPDFMFAQGYTNLNQGSYGSIPRQVYDYAEKVRREQEENPDLYFRYNLSATLTSPHYRYQDDARTAIASLIGANASDVVLTENASYGLSAVIRSVIRFLGHKRTSMLYLDTAYGMVKTAMGLMAGQLEGADSMPGTPYHTPLIQVNISSMLTNITEQDIVDAVVKQLDVHADTIGLASFSHITSVPGMVMPVEALVRECHKRGVLVLIDGAHCPGHIEIDVDRIGADFYVGDLHKWLFNPRGSAFIHARPEHQALLLPPIGDHGPGDTVMQRFFSWQGTVDSSNYASVPAALAYRRSIGGEAAIIEYIHTLAVDAGDALATMWRTEVMVPSHHQIGALINVRVPCTAPCLINGTVTLMQAVWLEHGIVAPVGAWGADKTQTWVRLTAQVYNEMDDYLRYGRVVESVLRREGLLTHA